MDLKNLLKPNLKKIILFFVLYIIIHLPSLLYLMRLGIVFGMEDITMMIASTSRMFFSASRTLSSEVFLKVSPFILVIILYLISCWTVRGLSKDVLNGKSRNWKVIIISSVILQFVLIGFLGRHVFYSIVPSDRDPYEISKIAESTQIVFLCNFINVDYKREHCIRDIAKEKQKPSLCDKINDRSIRNECYSSLGSCAEVDYAPTKSRCYSTVAMLNEDVSICEMAGSNRDTCLIDIARETRDMSICNNKVGIALKEKCISEVIRVRQAFGAPESDVEDCRMLHNASARNNCLFAVAEGTDNIVLCQEVTNDKNVMHSEDLNRKDYCYYYFAIYSDKHKGDRYICNKIESKHWKSRCLKEVVEQ